MLSRNTHAIHVILIFRVHLAYRGIRRLGP